LINHLRQKRSRGRIEKDRLREIEAINLDQAEIEEAIRLQASLVNPVSAKIHIYKMDEPTENPPITIGKQSEGSVPLGP